MKIAIDLDGTLSRFPKVLIEMATMLQRSGADVFVLTATAGELPPVERPAEARRRLNKLGATNIPAICLEQSDKPKYCMENHVDILIDDTVFDLNGTVQLIPK